MKYQCSICNGMFENGVQASSCFYSHEDYMDHFLVDETDLEQVCQLAVEKKRPEDILMMLSSASMHLSYLVDPMAIDVSLISKEDIRKHLREIITGNLLLLTQAANLFGDCDELDSAMKKSINVLKKDLKDMEAE